MAAVGCNGLVRPDDCYKAALDSISVGKLGSKKEYVATGGHVAGCVQYVCWKAVQLANSDTVLFGVDESFAASLPSDPLAGGFLDGVVWQIVINFLKSQVADPAILDKLAAWLAGFLK